MASTEATTLRLAVLPRRACSPTPCSSTAGAGADRALGAALHLAAVHAGAADRTDVRGMLVGASLGGIRGSASSLLYVLIGIAGAPVYAHGASAGAWSGATGGYLVGLPLAAALTGYLAEKRWDRRVLLGRRGDARGEHPLIYLVGLPWLAVVLNTNLEKTFEFGLYPFVAGDLFKVYLAAVSAQRPHSLIAPASTPRMKWRCSTR